MKTINIGNYKLFKISHGAHNFFPEEKIIHWRKKNIVVVHGDTHSIATSNIHQGNTFIKDMKVGDYFYSCHGSEYFITFGRITSDAKPLPITESDPNGEGYYYREYEVIQIPVNNEKYYGEKHWWSPTGNTTIVEIESKHINLANELIFKKYFALEIKSTIIENKISRICWNSNFWQFPSGEKGKSKNKGSFEYQFGYGHEEWLNNKFRVIDDYIYGHLQSIAKYNDDYKTYVGKIFNITLYSKDGSRNVNFIVGEISNAIVITPQESLKMFHIYNKKGWIDEMAEDVKAVKGNYNKLLSIEAEKFFNIKYKSSDISILVEPIKILNSVIYLNKNNYYHLINKTTEPELENTINKEFLFKSGHNKGKTEAIITYTENRKKMDLVHNNIKDIIYQQLYKEYGNNVGTENDTGFGSKIDIVRKDNKSLIFYELKTGHNLKLCIREALAQLLEYAYFPGRRNADKIIIIAQHKIDSECTNYLNHIRKEFNIPVWYQYYNSEKQVLESKLY